MKTSRQDIETTIQSEQMSIGEAEWGAMHLGWETFFSEMDVAPLLKGLPDDRCQCPHFGYMVKGKMYVNYQDVAEVITAGEAYYLVPGHAVKMDSGSEVVEFSPKEEFHKTMEVVTRNLEKMQAS
ncbi:MAG: cupin domain-containing protein [Dehalococcoidia bacterium]|nr:cupin domain-containing protein [Dehalococcoidia bacterium]